ncbi:MAG: esterase [Betaproteobacteria bacterium]|nr:esterase [Betaproteobacteria bacterium]
MTSRLVPQTLLYAHGFRSSSRSRKAGELRAALAARSEFKLVTPDLDPRPTQAISQLQWHALGIPPQQLALIGSSLGGYYAWVLAEKLGCRAVLLNPSLKPYETLAAHTGAQTNLHSGAAFDFPASHLDELRALAPPHVSRPERYLVVVEMGDALLDHRATLDAFAGARHIAVQGGSHDLDSFPQHIPALLDFCHAHTEP